MVSRVERVIIRDADEVVQEDANSLQKLLDTYFDQRFGYKVQSTAEQSSVTLIGELGSNWDPFYSRLKAVFGNRVDVTPSGDRARLIRIWRSVAWWKAASVQNGQQSQ